MINLATALFPRLATERPVRPRGVVGLVAQMLGEQLRYLRALSELNRLDDSTLDDIGISRDELPDLARRHARGLPPRTGSSS
jgi:uncharacterized protein YjiS (DUF1127 family)